MADVIFLDRFKRESVATKALEYWNKRFPEKLGVDTRFSDLTDSTLAFLIQSREESSWATYELIMAMKNLGGKARFFFMEDKEKIVIIELGMFLLDQFRFECLKRLGWIESYPAEEYPILELIDNYDVLSGKIRNTNPLLSRNHPQYEEFERATKLDKEVIIRRLFPEALKVFCPENTGDGSSSGK
ncbi:MAG TPA: hypothetical protein ENG51_11665 [Deltaproteobacteria bacterium]|nr:hypothetical protein [Deltaproteobacteria bacterium]